MPQIKNQSVTNLKIGKAVSPSELAGVVKPSGGTKKVATPKPTGPANAASSKTAPQPAKP